MKPNLICLLLPAAIVIAACAPNHLPNAEGKHRAAVSHLKAAESRSPSAEERAVLYLMAAREASGLLDSADSSEAARQVYNQSAAGLTVLLRASANGGMWNRPITLSAGGATYQLRFARGTRDGVWDPALFTSFTPADTVKMKTLDRRNRQDGVGGALVGVRKTQPLEPFSPLVGIAAQVTAVIDFHGNIATLTLVDATEKTKARIAGRERTLDADFSAPLAYYPQKSEYWNGIMGAIRVSSYMKTTGLYMLEPYDPDRIPVIFVHGLISTPRMWRNVINELETDPVLRGRYQCWVFSYPTGNPPLYSALRFREDLKKVRQLHPDMKDCVLVGHSMGGLISRAQVTTLDRDDWDVIGKDKADRFFANMQPGGLVERATVFRANPHVGRAIFICTPHRGSEMAVGSLGELAIRLISLPADITTNITSNLGESLAVITGDAKRLPNSVTGLSPRNPGLKALDSRPIEVPYHSIIGDRGKGDTPQSSDGVVQYWSSRQQGAKSELIVPGPHGACELPETIAELRRLLHLHLQQN